MKKTFLLMAALLLGVALQLSAQSKEGTKVLKDLEKAKATAEKKADKADSWLKLGEAYAACYDAPIVGLRLDAAQMEAKLFLKDQVVLKTENREIAGQQFSVDVYSDKEIYYSDKGVIAAIVIKTPVLTNEDPLAKAFEAFRKAETMAAKDVKTSLVALARRYFTEGLSSYRIGDNKNASKGFEMSYVVTSEPAVGEVDSTSLFYAAVTAALAKDNQRAIKFFTECEKIGYEQDGEVYAYMADCYKGIGDTTKTKEILSRGFAKYPTSQGILVALINVYLETKDDPAKVLEVIHAAQANEPSNASLYYAEAGVYKNLKDTDSTAMEKAIELYKKAAATDPTYMYAPWALGEAYYSMGLDVQEKASMERDDNKYARMVEDLDKYLKLAIEPFETVFNKATDPDMKRYSAEYLKNIYFRFRTTDDYQAKYDNIVKFLEEN